MAMSNQPGALVPPSTAGEVSGITQRLVSPRVEKESPEQMVSVDSLSRKQMSKLRRHFREDEIGYTIGVANVLLTMFVVARYPGLYWIYHCAKAILLLSWRFCRFRTWKGEFYLIEWCYFATYYTCIGCVAAFCRVQFGLEGPLEPYGSLFVRAGFVLATGSLAWAVFIYKNALIFHDIDQITSLFIHLSPAVLAFCVRWGAGMGVTANEKYFPDMFRVCPGDLAVEDQCVWRLWCNTCPVTFQEMFVVPIFLYLFLWAFPYYVVRFLILPGWIESTGRETLYAWTLQEKSQNLFVKQFPNSWKPFAFMLQHFLLVLVSSTFSSVFWHSFWLHAFFIVTLVYIASNNGAKYTFRVFATQYAQKQLKKHPSIVDTD